MKVRFYADVPLYGMSEYGIFATSKPTVGPIPTGWKRVAFDVDMPPDVLREYDAKAPAEFKGVIDL